MGTATIHSPHFQMRITIRFALCECSPYEISSHFLTRFPFILCSAKHSRQNTSRISLGLGIVFAWCLWVSPARLCWAPLLVAWCSDAASTRLESGQLGNWGSDMQHLWGFPQQILGDHDTAGYHLRQHCAFVLIRPQNLDH